MRCPSVNILVKVYRWSKSQQWRDTNLKFSLCVISTQYFWLSLYFITLTPVLFIFKVSVWDKQKHGNKKRYKLQTKSVGVDNQILLISMLIFNIDLGIFLFSRSKYRQWKLVQYLNLVCWCSRTSNFDLFVNLQHWPWHFLFSRSKGQILV